MSTHDDDRDEDDGQQQSGLSPVRTPPIQSDRAPAAGEDEFDVVETDAQGKVIGGAAPEREEGNLSQDEGGDQPLIRQQDDGQGGERRPKEPKSQRNARRRESRERSFQENQRLERENAELRQRMDALEGTVGTQIAPRLLELGEGQIRQQAARLDAALQDAGTAARAARAKMATAMSTSDNEMLTEALDERDKAIIRQTQLQNEKTQVDKALEQVTTRQPTDRGGDQRRDAPPQQRQQQQAPLPTRAQHFASEFGRENDWFVPQDNTDVDSQTVLAIDRAVAKEGFDPSTPDYWAEIDDRMREKMPWRFKDDGRQQQQDSGQRREAPAARQQTPAQQQRRGPPTAGASDRAAPSGGRKSVTISPDRKQAMIDSGAIGNDGRVLDAKKYQRQLKAYAQFDVENKTGTR